MGKGTREYRVWETPEEEALRQGVAKHGLGAWEKIRSDPEFLILQGRTGVQLKDKWRNLVKFRHVRPSDGSATKSGGTTRKQSLASPSKSRSSDKSGRCCSKESELCCWPVPHLRSVDSGDMEENMGFRTAMFEDMEGHDGQYAALLTQSYKSQTNLTSSNGSRSASFIFADEEEDNMSDEVAPGYKRSRASFTMTSFGRPAPSGFADGANDVSLSTSDNTEWDDTYIVDCPCGLTYDDGRMMIECEQCKNWAHLSCLQAQVISDPMQYAYNFDRYLCLPCQNIYEQTACHSCKIEDLPSRDFAQLHSAFAINQTSNRVSPSISSCTLDHFDHACTTPGKNMEDDFDTRFPTKVQCTPRSRERYLSARSESRSRPVPIKRAVSLDEINPLFHCGRPIISLPPMSTTFKAASYDMNAAYTMQHWQSRYKRIGGQGLYMNEEHSIANDQAASYLGKPTASEYGNLSLANLVDREREGTERSAFVDNSEFRLPPERYGVMEVPYGHLNHLLCAPRDLDDKKGPNFLHNQRVLPLDGVLTSSAKMSGPPFSQHPSPIFHGSNASIADKTIKLQACISADHLSMIGAHAKDGSNELWSTARPDIKVEECSLARTNGFRSLHSEGNENDTRGFVASIESELSVAHTCNITSPLQDPSDHGRQHIRADPFFSVGENRCQHYPTNILPVSANEAVPIKREPIEDSSAVHCGAQKNSISRQALTEPFCPSSTQSSTHLNDAHEAIKTQTSSGTIPKAASCPEIILATTSATFGTCDVSNRDTGRKGTESKKGKDVMVEASKNKERCAARNEEDNKIAAAVPIASSDPSSTGNLPNGMPWPIATSTWLLDNGPYAGLASTDSYNMEVDELSMNVFQDPLDSFGGLAFLDLEDFPENGKGQFANANIHNSAVLSRR